MLAINRGEAQKILSVKVVVPDYLLNKFTNFCSNKFIHNVRTTDERKRILNEAIKDSYTRLSKFAFTWNVQAHSCIVHNFLVQPLVVRQIRSELKLKAEKASHEVFATNLKQLLLAPPLKGKSILAIDPGYANGCKIALISETGGLLASDVIYPHKSVGEKNRATNTIKHVLEENK